MSAKDLKVISLVLIVVSPSLVLCAEISKETSKPSCFANRNFYVRDPIKSKQLAFWEQPLAAALAKIQNDQSLSTPCHSALSNYLLEYDRDTRAVQGKSGVLRAALVAQNPILLYRMVHRLVERLRVDVNTSCSYHKKDKIVLEVVEDTFETVGLTMPTDEDIKAALHGLSVIQYMYGLNATSELSFGIFKNVQTKARLYFEDCLLLAEMALASDAEAMAYQWLISAFIRMMEDSQGDANSENMAKLEKVWQKLLNVTGVKSMNELNSLFSGKRQESYHDYSEYSMYSICRGENTRPLDYQASLNCFYEPSWNPYYYINPLKVEIVALKPTIFQFHNMVSNRTIEAIRRNYTTLEDKTGSSILTGTVNNDNGKLTSKENVKDLRNLNKNIEWILGLKWVNEDMQIVLNTRLSGFTNVHQLRRTAAGVDEPENVLATVIIYMSDVELAGLTAFYKINTFARPIKGSILAFHNVRTGGVRQRGVAYEPCPVILGNNEWARKWIF